VRTRPMTLMDIPRVQRYRLQCWFAGRMVDWLIAGLVAGTLICGVANAQSGEPNEYEVKAAFLFNFTKFVEWPDTSFSDPHAPILLGIIGDDPFGESLTTIVAGQKVEGRTIIIQKHRYGDDLRHCQILFVSASERAHVAQILASVQLAGVMTVSDIDGFAEAGGLMQFVIEENRVRFLVNLDVAKQSKLRVSAKLLALAHVVHSGQAVR
jgi:uncharacterized protein DUF4154